MLGCKCGAAREANAGLLPPWLLLLGHSHTAASPEPAQHQCPPSLLFLPPHHSPICKPRSPCGPVGVLPAPAQGRKLTVTGRGRSHWLLSAALTWFGCGSQFYQLTEAPSLISRSLNLICRAPNLICRCSNLIPKSSNLIPRSPNLICRSLNLIPMFPNPIPRARWLLTPSITHQGGPLQHPLLRPAHATCLRAQLPFSTPARVEVFGLDLWVKEPSPPSSASSK